MQAEIKALLITLMLSAPARVRAQLSEALVCIGQSDYPGHWPRLLPELLEKLQLGVPNITNGVLETTHSIYKRYRNQVLTEALSKELEYSQVGCTWAPCDLAGHRFSPTFQFRVGTLANLVLVSMHGREG